MRTNFQRVLLGNLSGSVLAACIGSGQAVALTIGFTSGEFDTLPRLVQEAAVDAALRTAAPWSGGADVTVRLRFEGFEPGNPVLASATSYRSDYDYAAVRDALGPGLGPGADALLQPGDTFTYLANGDGSLGRSRTLSVNSATAKQLRLTPNASGKVDGEVSFNSGMAFDFDPSDGIAPDAYDFEGILMHEIGHILGFHSSTGQSDQVLASRESPTLLDLFRFSDLSLATGAALGIDYMPDLSDDARAKYFLGASGVEGAPLTAIPQSTGAHGDGAQPSHWKAGLDLGLMDPFFHRGEERAQWGANDLMFFDAIGYDLCCEQGAESEPAPVPIPPAIWGLLLGLAALIGLRPGSGRLSRPAGRRTPRSARLPAW